jgi:hypothetical protein
MPVHHDQPVEGDLSNGCARYATRAEYQELVCLMTVIPDSTLVTGNCARRPYRSRDYRLWEC